MMTTATAQFTKAEIVRRGKEIYERDLRSQVEAGNVGRVLAIDVLSAAYELADDELASIRQLRTRQPDAVIFLMRPLARLVSPSLKHHERRWR